MSGFKARVLDLQARLKGHFSGTGQETAARLRANELYRLLSIINKVKWGHELNLADRSDLEEIEAIEKGQRALIYSDKRFFPPAFARYDSQGVLCWFQDMREGPLRELNSHERALWKRVGPSGFHGYLRLDGSISAYALSGCEDSEIPSTYSDPEDIP
ncbi:MAG: hypothetical protein R6V55_10830 [Desulfovermiculus sp.]